VGVSSHGATTPPRGVVVCCPTLQRSTTTLRMYATCTQHRARYAVHYVVVVSLPTCVVALHGSRYLPKVVPQEHARAPRDYVVASSIVIHSCQDILSGGILQHQAILMAWLQDPFRASECSGAIWGPSARGVLTLHMPCERSVHRLLHYGGSKRVRDVLGCGTPGYGTTPI